MGNDHHNPLLLEILRDDHGVAGAAVGEEEGGSAEPPPNSESGLLVLGSAPYEYSYRYHVRSSRHKRPHHYRSSWKNSTRSENRSLHYHRHNNFTAANYTITTSVSIRVTPVRDHFVSWGILWGLFVLTCLVGAYQVYRECLGQRHRKILVPRRHHGRRIAGRRHRDEDDDDEEDVDNDDGGVDGEGEISTADITRSLFRRLLLLAMVARTILMPVQIWSWPIWWQFVGDTLPEMVFASAWCLLVTFFIQLVGVATGTGTNTSPGIVIQATAYVIYTGLIITQLVDLIATVLIYALLCVIYAALLGVIIYYGPRLWTLLQPGLVQQHKGLAWRLAACTFLAVFVLAAHAVEYALLVVAPPKKVYWWWTYGVLELLPSVVFLALMNPIPNKSGRNNHAALLDHAHNNNPPGHHNKSSNSSVGSLAGIRRVDSSNSTGGFFAGASRNKPQSSETSTLLKPGTGYGSVAVETTSAVTLGGNSITVPSHIL